MLNMELPKRVKSKEELQKMNRGEKRN